MNEQDKLLSTVMASSIHEIKNGFNTLISQIDHLVNELPDNLKCSQDVTHIQTETFFISNQLNQLLTCYRDSEQGYSVNITEQFVFDLLEEVINKHKSTTGLSYRCHIEFNCSEDLVGFFDAQLIANVLDTGIYNASKIPEVNNILVSANLKDGYLCLQIEDDGPGFPDSLLHQFARSDSGSPLLPPNFDEGTTGLGLHFAEKMLEIHENKGKTGFLKLSNNKQACGACLELFIP